MVSLNLLLTSNLCSSIFEKLDTIGAAFVSSVLAMLQHFSSLLFLSPLILPVARSCTFELITCRVISLIHRCADLHGPNANHATDLFNALDRRYNDGPKPARDDITKWAALGDSFSAGPGAGCVAANDEGTCWRRLGSYAPQLNRSAMFQDSSPAGFGQPEVDFGACSGAKMPKVSERSYAPPTPLDPCYIFFKT